MCKPPNSKVMMLLAAAAALFGVTVVSQEADAYDMDCKVILCLAGGFPSGCGDAHSYMMDRLEDGKPPFGPCTTEGPGGSALPYDDYAVNTGVDRWTECPGGYAESGGRWNERTTYCVGGLKRYRQSYVHIRLKQDDGQWYDPGHYRYGRKQLIQPRENH